MRMETPRTEGNAMKKIIPGLAASAAVMLALPWLAVTYVNGDSGMMACGESDLCDSGGSVRGQADKKYVGAAGHYRGPFPAGGMAVR